MWPKEDYQEHMLGYLDELRVEFEQLLYAHVQQYDSNEFYANLDITSDCLWQLIGASDTDWEEYRDPLEASCDALLRKFRQLPSEPSFDIASNSITSFILMGVRVIQLEAEPTTQQLHESK